MARHVIARDDAEDIDNLGPYLERVIWVLAGLSALFLGLRLYCKIWRRRQLWWDDYILIASWVSLVVSTSLQSAAVSHGLGTHYYDQTIEQKDIMGVFSISAGLALILAASWSKTSFAISLLRIAGDRARVCTWFVIVSVNLVFAANGIIQWVQCWPVRKQWDARMVEGTCLAPDVVQNFITFVAAYSGAMDIALALLPWAVIWTASINKKEKMGAMLAMSLGVFAGVMSFLKISTLHAIGDDNAINVDLFIFGTAEPATAIMAASMPILRVLFHRKSESPTRLVEITDGGRVTTRSIRMSKEPPVFSA